MSSITVSEASGFSNPDVSQRYHFDDRPVDQFFEVLPMEPIEGHQKRVNTVQASDLYTHASLVTGNGGAVAATLPATLTREGNLSHFAARLEVDSLVADEYSSHRDVVRSLLQVKVAALLARFQYQLVRGDQAQAGEFHGLIKLGGSTSFGADGGNADGGVVAKGEIEKVIGALASNGGIQGRYLVMRTSAFDHLYRNNYGNQIFVLQHARLGPLPAISGVPILLNDYIPGDQAKGLGTNLTTIFAVNVGSRGLTGIFPSKNRGREVLIRGPLQKQGTDTLYFDCTAQFGLAVYQHPAVAALDGVAHQV